MNVGEVKRMENEMRKNAELCGRMRTWTAARVLKAPFTLDDNADTKEQTEHG